MSEQKKYEFPTLQPDDIEVKVKKVGKTGTNVLLYKTSRTDMRYLDEVYGVNNWQVDYQMIGDMLFCTILLWDEEKKQWIKKQSNGIESREDGEGNEKKGWSSDAMKRAGFVAGCGRELYSAPFTFIPSSKLPTKQDEKNPNRWLLEDPFTKFAVSVIDYDNKRRINRLEIVNQKTGEVLYSYGMNSNRQNQPKQEAPKPKATPKQSAPQKKEEEQKQETPALEAKVNAVVETAETLPKADVPPHEKVFYNFLERHKIDKKTFAEWRAIAVRGGKNVTQKKFTDLVPDEWIMLIATMENLFEEGFFNK